MADDNKQESPAKQHLVRLRAEKAKAQHAKAAEAKEQGNQSPKRSEEEIQAERKAMLEGGRRISPARAHFQAAATAKQSGDTPKNKVASGDQYELMSAALWEARRTLKDIKSIEAKIEKKRQLLPQFSPYVDGVLKGGTGAQDDVLMTCMVWCFDIGDLRSALAIAEYALKHDLQTPDRYERDTSSLVAEQTADEALKLLDKENPDIPGLVQALQRADQLTAEADMHDQIRAKLHKALGYALRAAGNLEAALKHLQRALKLNDRAGVKKDIEQLEREIKKQGEAQSQAN
jgi:tetratricopeptide (TPR) repeat protein